MSILIHFDPKRWEMEDILGASKLIRQLRLEKFRQQQLKGKEYKEQEQLELLLSVETLLNEFYKRLLFEVGPVFEKTFILYTHPDRVKLN